MHRVRINSLGLVFVLSFLGLVGCGESPISMPIEDIAIEDVINREDANILEDVVSGVVEEEEITENLGIFSIESVPEFSGNPYYVINDNIPFFEKSELTTDYFEEYSELDELGRCGVCVASVSWQTTPNGEREGIGQVKPTGWHTVKYDCVDGKYLYNRCHLIGYQLTGENANERNLITGTRYLNIEGMLPFENMVDDYVDETGNHVIYRVTPIYEGVNLVASGVLMEGYSIEDEGEHICFNVYCYNVQPGVSINYADGSSREGTYLEVIEDNIDDVIVWCSATGSKYHSVNDCGTMNPVNAINLYKSYAEGQGLKPCEKCF